MRKLERVTVTLPAELVEGIDRSERNRSRFVAEAVANELLRRRRESLLRSVRNPHRETTELVDAGLADWTRDLTEDVDLVNANAGTAVHWVEGEGWIED